MVNIFDYEDYREYLTAYFKEKKAQNPHTVSNLLVLFQSF